ncbi:hypothetical protein M404DRAFT_851885 [Pisolithus tinctorius Marx 270]|uniref:Uncharacterized protein n=1 Tax=Pisolithus tinctorius Marx 270 TaxID=870435 RepID=A0A0C3IND5_PISTI|nr:hypothetical protein M404DRAFT_851885 [Pisolithus tinctorius Marx 270]
MTHRLRCVVLPGKSPDHLGRGVQGCRVLKNRSLEIYQEKTRHPHCTSISHSHKVYMALQLPLYYT